MADAADNALISFDDYCDFVGKAKTDIGITDGRFNLFCGQASSRIEKYCRRKFIAGSVAEVHSGDNTKELYLHNCPVTATPTVKYWDGLAWVATTATFTYDSTTGRLWFTDGSVFWEGKDNWQVTYSYGYAIAEIPYELRLACATLIQRAFKKADGKEGVTSETFADQTTAFSLSKMPEDVAEILQSYVRQTIG